MAARSRHESRRRRRLALFAAGATLLAVALAVAWERTDAAARDDGASRPRATPLELAGPTATAHDTARDAGLPRVAEDAQPAPLADDPDVDPYALPARLRVDAELLAPTGKPAADALLALLDGDGALLAHARADARGRVRLKLPRPTQAPFSARPLLVLVHGRGFAPTLQRRALESHTATLELGEVALAWITGDTDCDVLLDVDDVTRVERLWARFCSTRSPLSDTAPEHVSVRVFDASGEPASGALVRRFTRADNDMRPYLAAVLVDPPPRLHFAWTDVRGVAQLPLPRAEAHYVVAVARGHRATGSWLPSLRTAPVDLHLEALPLRQFRLSIGGVPVDDVSARVALWRREPGPLDPPAQSRVLDPELSYSVERKRWLLRAEADARVVLEVQHPEHGRRLLTLEPGVGTHDLPRFELGAGAGFTLSASNTRGEPLARQRFELTQVERPGMPANSGQRRVLFADADGVVSAHALAPGAWDLTPQSPPREPANPHSSPVGWRGPTRRLHLEPGEHLRGAPLAIESGSVLIVRAVAPGSAPELDELTPVLRLGSVSSGSPPVSGPHPVTAGVWRFENVPSGRHRVLLGTRGRTDVDVPPDGRAECAVHVSGWLEVTGRVTRAGEPVPRASILVNRRLIALKDSDATVFGNLEMSSNFSQIEADEAGRFSTQVLEGETLWLFASDSTAEFVSEARELVPREGEATHVELTLHPREDVPQAPDLATLIRR